MNSDERLQIAKCNLFSDIGMEDLARILSILEPRSFTF